MIEVNYLAVLVAGIASMTLGFFWYSPVFLGNLWIKEKGFTKESLKKAQKEMGKWYVISSVLSLLTAFVLSHVMVLSQAFFHYPIFQTGLTTAFWMWLGFIMPVQATATIFGGKNWTLFAIDTGFQGASVVVMAIVLALL